jgi:hypothetical protein
VDLSARRGIGGTVAVVASSSVAVDLDRLRPVGLVLADRTRRRRLVTWIDGRGGAA